MRPTLRNMPNDVGSLPTGGTLAFALFYFMLCVYVLGLWLRVWSQFSSCIGASQLDLMCSNNSWFGKLCFCLNFVHGGYDRMLTSKAIVSDSNVVLDSEQDCFFVCQGLTNHVLKSLNPERADSRICMSQNLWLRVGFCPL